jgi:hypothetical protein
MSDTSLAVPDGMRLSDWWTSRDVPRSTAFRLLRAAGIEPAKVRAPGSQSPVSFLSAAQLEVLDNLVARLKAGATLTSIEGILARRSSRPEPSQDVEVADDEPPGPELLLARLQAAQLAIATGLPLSTAEIAWLLGARPGGPAVTRGRVTARRHARNVWSLEPSRDV